MRAALLHFARHFRCSKLPPQKRMKRVPYIRRRRLFLGLGAWMLTACEDDDETRVPAEVVREFVELLHIYDGRPEDAQAIFNLLSERARANLTARAERYGAASGKKITAPAMIVPGWLTLRFVPQAYAAQVVGRYALVEVSGVRPTDRAQIPCIREEDHWRVDLALPELPPMITRPEGTP